MDHTGKSSGSYFMFLKEFFSNFSDLSGYFGTFTPAHLWFILYLFVLSILALPVFHFLRTEKPKHFIHYTMSKPSMFILFFIVLALTTKLPAPGGQNPFFYFVLFIMGYITSSDQRFQEMFNRLRLRGLLVILISVPIWVFLVAQNDDIKSLLMDSFLTLFRMFNVWMGLIVIHGYGHKYLNKNHRLLPFLNEAAFPVYIIHQTVLVVIGYYVIRLDLTVPLKYVLIMISTLTVSLLIFEFVIKRTPLTRFLFGVKVKKGNSGAGHSNNKSM